MITIPLILPLLPLLGWGLGILLGGIGIAAVAGAFEDPKKNKLGILGMQQAGKTRFLDFLRNRPFMEGSSGRNSYPEFKYKLPITGKEITISSGKDLGGGAIYRGDYNSILDNNDVIVYFFDIDKYLKNELDFDKIPYQRSCNSRFEHIYSNIKISKKPTLIIATHKDKCRFSENEMKQELDALIKDKPYKDLLEEVQYVNLTNNEEVRGLVNKIFNKK